MRSLIILVLLATTTTAQQKTYIDKPAETICKVTFDGPNNQTSMGSGTLVEADLVLSCAHIVRGNECRVEFGHDQVAGKVIAIDLYWDWSLIRLAEKRKAEPMKLREKPLAEGMRIASYGYGGGRYGVHRGIYERGRFFCNAISGDSGGAIVDSDGCLIAVTQAVVEDKRREIYGHNYQGLRKWVEGNRK